MEIKPSAALAPPIPKITWRSIAVGSLLALCISVLTPFNDYVVANTFLIGSYLPLVMVLELPFLPWYRAISFLAWVPNLIIAELWLRRRGQRD
jgi:hypothetical protein